MADRLPSVTQIIGQLDKPGLSWAAARETALFAVNHIDEWYDPEWQTITQADAVHRLRKHHRGIWDHRAALGTLVHQVNESWARGETVDLDVLVRNTQAGHHVWATRPTDEVVAEASIMVDGLEAAWEALNPETISVEDVVRYPKPLRHAYIGQSDWRAVIDGHTYLIDVKTTGECDPTKAYYFDSWRLQLGAYRGCTEIVHYSEDRVHRPYAKGLEETHTSKLPRVERTAILHIRANGKWEFIPVGAGQTEMNRFLMLRELWTWLKSDGTKAGAEMHIPKEMAV